MSKSKNTFLTKTLHYLVRIIANIKSTRWGFADRCFAK